ncbi:S1/P1 nuclease [Maribacter sp. 2304DJ31-5]|uniref:S1/P1 nuclease n=1 Tax=Maribacter sp. 2304DJ31-5 TaxID=3386273 RepID=UPI0039BD6E82
MKRLTLILFLAFQASFGNDMVWSKTGHRVIGEVAENYLSRKARKAIAKLLNGQSLAAISNFGDEIKADKRYREFSAWHYVNFPEDKKYGEVPPSKYGDLITGIHKCISVVKDQNSPSGQKAFYLKLLVHLIGDLHQPMHVGRLKDRGGNDLQVQWFGRESNLHKIWDLNMIEDYGMSYTELAEKLPKINKAQVKELQKGDIYDWVEESRDIANLLYASVTAGEKIGYGYGYKWWGTVEHQLQKGGVRLAAVLNAIFG